MIFRAIALNDTELAPVRKASVWPALIAGALILHAALVLSETMQGVAWVAWVECVIASLVGLARLRESAEPAETRRSDEAVYLRSMAARPQAITRPRA